MTSIKLNPRTTIILDANEKVSRFFLYAGVEVNRSYKQDTFIKDLRGLLIDLCASYLQAYNINSRYVSTKSDILGYLRPTIDESIDPECKDSNLRYLSKTNKIKINSLLNKLNKNGVSHGVFLDESDPPIMKFNFIQSLYEKFNPLITANFITLVQRYATFCSNKFQEEVIQGNLEDNLIFFHTKLKKRDAENCLKPYI